MQSVPGVFRGTDRFKPMRHIGKGGFGDVYEVLDTSRGNHVALKVLRHAEGASLYRFKREFRAVADINHPNLVGLHDLLTDGRQWFFTMELVAGEPITSYVRPERSGRTDGPFAERPLVEERLRHVLPQLADALDTLHRRGIVHCDIKPSNVLVTAAGRVVVLDFGLLFECDPVAGDDQFSTYTSVDGLVVFGTPAYMAPEQTSSATAAADWYATGVILYEALTGALPFSGSGIEQLEAKQQTPPKPPHEISGASRDLSDICMALLDLDPRVRESGAQAIRARVARPAHRVEPTAAREALVGREPHLAALRAAYDAALKGKAVLAMVSGVSGMGKTTLIRHFLSEQRRNDPDLITLEGRCYEREATPYKALDPLIDALAQHLRQLPDIDVAWLLTRDSGLLARLFPVLTIVSEIQRAPDYGAAELDSVAVRRRAAAALGNLLFELAVRRPLVLSIDDAQWGDADSAFLLEQILQSPDPPPLLLIAAFRAEDAAAVPFVGALQRLGTDDTNLQRHAIEVGPLSAEHARDLATQLTTAAQGVDLARAVANESGGNPFFLHELARHASISGRASRLDAVIADRLDTLPRAARRFLEVASLSAQAPGPSVIEAAAGLGGDEELYNVTQLLRAERLIRVALQGSDRTIEPYHDRIRESVIARLTTDDVRGVHLALARAWEQSGRAGPETLTTHFLGAGEVTKTIQYAEQAAGVAWRTFAFDRATELYRLLIRLDEQPARRHNWQVSLGDALVNRGHGFDAAQAYLSALPEAEGAEAIELEGRAAAELIRAGYLEEATAVLNALLPKVGIRPPGGLLRSLATLLQYRLMIAWRGLTVHPQRESSVPRDALERIDVLTAIAPPLTLIDMPRGLALNVQAVWHALQAGEPKRAAVGLAVFASSSVMSGTKTLKKSLRAVELAKALAEPLHDEFTTARTYLAEGICLKVSGHWVKGIEQLDRAIDAFGRCRGARWEIETAHTLRHDAMIWTGDWRKLAAEIPIRRVEAKQRGDRYSTAHVEGRLSPLMQLAAGRLTEAREEVDSARHVWAQPNFNMQHRSAICTLLDIDLYGGRPTEASDRFRREWPALRGTVSLFQNARIETQFYRARIALALAKPGRAADYEDAKDVRRRLTRERAEWASALATLVGATIADGTGDRVNATELLARAVSELDACDMKLYAAAARHRLGHVVGGQAGQDLIAVARQTMAEQGIAEVERIVYMLTPGFLSDAERSYT